MRRVYSNFYLPSSMFSMYDIPMLSRLIELDAQLFAFFHNWATVLPSLWKFISIYSIYIIPFFLVWFWFARRRDLALLAFFSGAFAWQGLNGLIGALVHRDRPTPFIDLNYPQTEFLFDRPGPSFPSDHTAFLVGMVVIFWLAGERRVSWFLIGLTVITVLSRVVTGQHWPGDILAGAVVGLVVGASFWMFRRPLERWATGPLVQFARRIGL